MPIIRIDYDDNKIKDGDAITLSEAIQRIVSQVTGIEDVFVYADSPKIKIKTAPVEIFVEMSAHKIANIEELMNKIKTRLSDWKQEKKFRYPINLTIIPMQWKIEIGI